MPLGQLRPATQRLIQDIKSKDTKLWQILQDLIELIMGRSGSGVTSLSTKTTTTLISGNSAESTLHSFNIKGGTLKEGSIINIFTTGLLSCPQGSSLNVRVKLDGVIGSTGDRML